MCDLVGSTGLCRRSTPEQLGDLLVAFYRCCNDLAQLGFGQVLRCVGDGVYMVFKSESHSTDAVRTAVRLRDSIPSALGRFAGYEASVRVTVASGAGIHTRVDFVDQPVVFGLLPFVANGLKCLAGENDVVLNDTAATSQNGELRLRRVSTSGHQHPWLIEDAWVVEKF